MDEATAMLVYDGVIYKDRQLKVRAAPVCPGVRAFMRVRVSVCVPRVNLTSYAGNNARAPPTPTPTARSGAPTN